MALFNRNGALSKGGPVVSTGAPAPLSVGGGGGGGGSHGGGGGGGGMHGGGGGGRGWGGWPWNWGYVNTYVVPTTPVSSCQDIANKNQTIKNGLKTLINQNPNNTALNNTLNSLITQVDSANQSAQAANGCVVPVAPTVTPIV